MPEHVPYGRVACCLRRQVGERLVAVLECEALHRRHLAADPDAFAAGVAAFAACYAGSVCPDCRSAERVAALVRTPAWDTTDGDLHPGDMYWATEGHVDGRCSEVVGGWANCEGRHLRAVLPNGHHWDLSARASNCTRPEDRLHRCWVLHGEPPNLTVDKDGLSCQAGGGSVASGDYHGYLREGAFVDAGPRRHHGGPKN